jgi:CRP-like cAMP-binding protein
MPANETIPLDGRDNAILAALPPDERARLEPMLQLVDVELDRNYQARGEPTAFVYFPTTGLFSLLSAQDDGRTVEVGALGREGFVGMPVVFEDDAPAFDTIGQIEGKAWRMRAGDLAEELKRGGALRRLLLRFGQAQFTQSAQTAACNRLHEIDMRTARWLMPPRA